MKPRKLPAFASVLLTLALPAGGNCAEKTDSVAEWTPLFDGKTSKGWTPRNKIVKLEANEGELHLLSKTNAWVVTETSMKDFIVELEVKLPDDAKAAKLNSGLAFRCQGAKGKPKGYQVEIDHQKPGGVYGIGLGGWLYPTKNTQAEYNKRAKGLFKEGDWNHFRVHAQGKRIRTFLNGKPVADVEHGGSLEGYFGIQHHGKGGTIRFRNIRVKPVKAAAGPVEKKRPNILWIVAEDMSPTLGCYGDKFATTPNLDKLARESLVYTDAFAVAPVCSPSRSCLITGIHPVTMGTNQMRSAFPVPRGVRGFPSYLRADGYFCANNVKTDYNTSDATEITKDSWDESAATAHWRSAKRKEGQPFFAVFNDMTTHQSRSMVWPHEAFQKHVQSKLEKSEIHDPAKVPLPPYYPDTPVVRKTMARYYDCVTVMDKNVGRILAELEEDGLAEDTIVFFYSDHGSGMPRHKRMLHDSGMRVALMVRVPEKWVSKFPVKAGELSDEQVNFRDFPPTVLTLAGLEIPPHMKGVPFIGQSPVAQREYVYGSRDRVDEAFDCARSVRLGRYLYVRNYLPHLSYNQPSVFSDLGAIRQELTRLHKKTPENLSEAQLHYLGGTRSAEELYDCETDPHQTSNRLKARFLTDVEKLALKRCRLELAGQRKTLGDVGCLPESEMRRWIKQEGMPIADIVAGKSNHRPDLDAIWKAADLVGKSRPDDLIKLLSSEDPSQRFWGVIGLRHVTHDNQTVLAKVAEHLLDASAPVRIEVAGWLAQHPQYGKDSLDVLVSELENKDWSDALRACRAIELLGKKAESVKPVMKRLYQQTRPGQGDRNLFLAFSSGAYLAALGEPTEPWDFTPKGNKKP